MIVITAMYGRHAIVDIALRQYQSMGVHVVVAGSDGEAGKALVEGYGFTYVDMPNHPVSRKFNAALRIALDMETPDGVLIVGSDNLISSGLMAGICDAAWKGYDMVGVLDAWEFSPSKNTMYYWPGYNNEIQAANGCPLREGEPVGSCKFISRRIIDAVEGQLWNRTRNSGLDWDMMQRIGPYLQSSDVRKAEDFGGIQIGWRDDGAMHPEAFANSRQVTEHDPREVLERWFESSTVERVLRVGELVSGRVRALGKRDQWGMDLIAKHGYGEYEVEVFDFSDAFLGGCGDSYIRDEHGIPRHVPHRGAYHLGDGVEIGAFVTIDRATLEGDSTVIGDHTKVFSHAHIGHNAKVGKRCLIMNGARIGGSCVIGDDVEIGLNACIRQHLTVGDGAIIGMGAVVTHDVPAGETWAGNPARRMR